jgi:hypothetical protein
MYGRAKHSLLRQRVLTPLAANATPPPSPGGEAGISRLKNL